ncbi:FAD-dependent oxidoreductase [Gordonia sp. CPCC 206044]|uniref:NAD(P)/FAD-dependent oxidoreductase n=1 Tax=Gordonia sp. CPCC 206044 TaxID=3140793 RepID=UPI003AF3C438
MNPSSGRSIAVVGSGVAGLVAAHLLADRHRVILFEADTRLGGHAHTHTVSMPDGDVLSVDSGFIVHNHRTYPTLQQVFSDLGIQTLDTDMSMSIRNDVTGLEYAGGAGFGGLFPTPRILTRGRYLAMLAEVLRFHREARRLLATPDSDEPLSEFIVRNRFSGFFTENFLLPLVASVWSCDERSAAAYPARHLFTFLDHHGMLSVLGSPRWRTVVGGSRTYVDRIADRVRGSGGAVHVDSPVRSVSSDGTGVRLCVGSTTVDADAVVVATHPHQALDLLAAPTDTQRRVLSRIPYSAKDAVLHTDTSLLPRARRARASWNHQVRADGSDVAVTYDLTRLMRLPTRHPRMLVTLGRTDLVEESTILAEMRYEHPLYTTDSVAAQALLPDLNTDTIVFAGAYHGWGFHEDGALSGARAAAALGATSPRIAGISA